ncbi:MAG: SDR family NAD(P)-dependent oxidoreductase [Acidobacteriota bacterium]
MVKEIYVITGATGNIGKRIAEQLLQRGKKVRVIGREQNRLKSLVEQGAEALVGSLEDSAFLTKAFQDAKAVFAMIPPNLTAKDLRAFQNRVSEALVNAIKATGVTHIVTLSSLGAHVDSGSGPILGLHDSEKQFNQLNNVNVVHLRPSFFMENLLNGIPTIKNLAINGTPIDANIAIPMIATKDIAERAVALLETLSFTGKSSQELLGAKDLTLTEATRALGEAIGKPDLKYVQFTYEDSKKVMLGLGLSASVVDAMLEMYEGINNGLLTPTESRSPKNTTPTTIAEFANEIFAPAFRSDQASHTAR